ncbi:MAG: hypothetical protein RSB50_06225 [Cetobacterium sp.]
MTNLEKAEFIAKYARELRINNGKIIIWTTSGFVFRFTDWTQEQYDNLKKIVKKNGGVIA